jgi:hypothetical protein
MVGAIHLGEYQSRTEPERQDDRPCRGSLVTRPGLIRSTASEMRNQRRGAPVLIIQMELPPLLAHDAVDGAVGGLLVGLAVQSHLDRKTARCLIIE